MENMNASTGKGEVPRCTCHRMSMKYMHNVTVQGIRIGLYVCAMGGEYGDYGPARPDDDDKAAMAEVAA